MNGAGSGLPPTDVAVPIGMRLIDSTPPATTTSYCPAISPAAAKCTDCCEDPHCRSTVTPVTVSGQPAVSAAVRAMSKVCSPTCETQPQMTSSTTPGSTPARSTSALSTCADRSAVCTPDNPPLRLPTGVRTASTITASRMSLTSPHDGVTARTPSRHGQIAAASVTDVSTSAAEGVGPRPEQRLLHEARRQHAVGGVQRPGVPAATGGHRARHQVHEHPVVQPRRPAGPQRVVQGGPRAGLVVRQGGQSRADVGQVGQRTRVQQRVVRQPGGAPCPEPGGPVRLGIGLRGPPSLEREQPRQRVLRQPVRVLGLRRRLDGDVGPPALAGERHRHVEDDLAALDRHDPPGRERPAVAVPVHPEDGGPRGVAAAQEVTVQRVRQPAVGHRPPGREQRLCPPRPAVERERVGEQQPAAVEVPVDLLQVEDVEHAVGAQRPFHTGARFSAKAVDPSRASSLAKTGPVISACRPQPSANDQSTVLRAICLVAATASGPLAAIVAASASAPSSAPPSGISRLTSPISAARGAVSGSPVSSISSASAYGTRLGSSIAAPPAATSERLTSGTPKRAVS